MTSDCSSEADCPAIPSDHFIDAFQEFTKRFLGENAGGNEPLALLVATNVDKDWSPDEETAKARYLLIPGLEDDNKEKAVLFMIYKVTREHAIVLMVYCKSWLDNGYEAT